MEARPQARNPETAAQTGQRSWTNVARDINVKEAQHMRNGTRRRIIGSLFAASLLIAACGDDSDSDTDEGDADTTDASDESAADAPGDSRGEPGGTPNDDAVFRLSYSVGPSRWDPHRANSSFDNTALFLTYDRLVHLTPDAEPVPGLATEWEFADDGSYLEMSLREGVTFHDGETFDADAVKANIERAQTLDDSAVVGELTIIDEVEVLDEHTVRLHVNGPAATLPLILSDRAGVMVSPAAFENPDLDEQPVGAGMFEVVDYEAGGHISYEAYEDYWDEEAVNVAGVEYLIQPDSITRLNAIRDGQIDWTFVDPSEAETAESQGLQITTGTTVAFYHVQLNRSFEPFGDARVRQAINMALDREAIVDGLLRGYAIPAVQPFPEDYFAYDEETGSDYYTYDPDGARELLEEAGYGDGFEFEVLIPAQDYFTQLSAVVQSQLAEVGLTVDIRSVPGENYPDDFYVQQKSEAGVTVWGGRHDPSLTGWQLFTDEGYANPGRHTTDEVMEAYEATLDIQSDDERTEALQAMSAAITEDALGVPLYNQQTPVVTTGSVTGYEGYTSGKPEFRGVGITD